MSTTEQKSKRERGYDGTKAVKSGFRDKMKKDGAFDGRFKSRVEVEKSKSKSRKACRKWNWLDELEALEEAEESENWD